MDLLTLIRAHTDSNRGQLKDKLKTHLSHRQISLHDSYENIMSV